MTLDAYLNYLRYERNFSALTVIAYRRDLLQFSSHLQKKSRILLFKTPEEVTPAMLRDWVVSLIEQGLVASSVNRKVSSLKSFFKYLVCQNVVSDNILMAIVGPKASMTLPCYVREKEMDDLLKMELSFESSFEEFRDHLIIEFLYSTGLRRSELIQIKKTDLDMSSLIVRVNGKRNKQRLVPFSAKLKDLLELYACVKKREDIQDGDMLFVRKNGACLTGSNVYYIVNKKLSCMHSTTKHSPHVLRHTFATSMLNNGAELNVVKDLLGHSSLASTSVYTHMVFEELKKSYHSHPRTKITRR